MAVSLLIMGCSGRKQMTTTILRPKRLAERLAKFGTCRWTRLLCADQRVYRFGCRQLPNLGEHPARVGIVGVRAKRGIDVGGSRKTKREGWPPSGAYRDFLEYLDKVREDNELRTYGEISINAHLAKSSISEFLTNAVEIPEKYVERLVLAMGGGPDEVKEALRLRVKARGSRGEIGLPSAPPLQQGVPIARTVQLQRLFDGASPEQGAGMLAELPAKDVATLLDSFDTWRIADMVAVMPIDKATRLLCDLNRPRGLELFLGMPSEKAAPLVAALARTCGANSRWRDHFARWLPF